MASRNNRPKDRDLTDEENAADFDPPSSDITSVEKTFEAKPVAPWYHQLTARAVIVSFILAVLFTFMVMKLNLITGIIPSLNVSAGLLRFFFVKTWTKLLAKSGLLKHPFTRQENTVIQTCVVAAGGIAFSGNEPLERISLDLGFNGNTLAEGLVVSICIGGALIGRLLSGWIANGGGRAGACETYL